MFGWFKKRPSELSLEMKAFADKTLGPQALAVAIAEGVRDYAAAVSLGRYRVTAPPPMLSVRPAAQRRARGGPAACGQRARGGTSP